MTPTHLSTLERMTRDNGLRPSEQDAIRAVLEERDAVIKIAGPLATPAANPVTHWVMVRILKAMGER